MKPEVARRALEHGWELEENWAKYDADRRLHGPKTSFKNGDVMHPDELKVGHQFWYPGSGPSEITGDLGDKWRIQNLDDLNSPEFEFPKSEMYLPQKARTSDDVRGMQYLGTRGGKDDVRTRTPPATLEHGWDLEEGPFGPHKHGSLGGVPAGPLLPYKGGGGLAHHKAVHCPHCGHVTSAKGATCEHCGHPLHAEGPHGRARTEAKHTVRRLEMARDDGQEEGAINSLFLLRPGMEGQGGAGNGKAGHGTAGKALHAPPSPLQESKLTPVLSVKHAPIGRGGENWITRSEPGNQGQLPAYVQNVRNAIMRSGHDEGSATAIAIGRIRDWAEGKGGVTAVVKAAAAKAIAEFEALRAKSRAVGAGKKVGKAAADAAKS